MTPIALSLLATVLLMVWMGFFALGSLPLLVLNHDTPLDARFIRGLFNVYYLAATFTGSAASLAYVWAGMPGFAIGTGCIAALSFSLRRWFIIPRMDGLRATMTAEDTASILRFRVLHILGMMLNVAQLGTLAWSLTKLKL